jgi:hypothetical protein
MLLRPVQSEGGEWDRKKDRLEDRSCCCDLDWQIFALSLELFWQRYAQVSLINMQI